jgi:hypothetical protein
LFAHSKSFDLLEHLCCGILVHLRGAVIHSDTTEATSVLFNFNGENLAKRIISFALSSINTSTALVFTGDFVSEAMVLFIYIDLY